MTVNNIGILTFTFLLFLFISIQLSKGIRNIYLLTATNSSLIIFNYLIVTFYTTILDNSFALLINYLFCFFIILNQCLTYNYSEKKRNKTLNEKILKYKIHPHFFYNTLNSIVSMVDNKPNLAKNTLIIFSNFLRKINDLDSKDLGCLKSEIEVIENYITLMKTRFEGKLKINLHTNITNLSILLPSMILLPIIENSLKYGYSKYHRHLIINIKIEKHHDYIHLTVENNGSHINNNFSFGSGLNNTKDRLQNLYGNKYDFEIHNNENFKGVTTTIKIPLV